MGFMRRSRAYTVSVRDRSKVAPLQRYSKSNPVPALWSRKVTALAY